MNATVWLAPGASPGTVLKRWILLPLLCLCATSSAARPDTLGVPGKQKRPGARNSATYAYLDSGFFHLPERIENLTNELNHANVLYQRGFDTSDIAAGLPDVELLVKLVRTSLFNFHNRTNLRSLYSVKVLLVQVQHSLEKWQDDLFSYSSRISQTSSKVNTMFSDSVFQHIAENPTIKQLYLTQFINLQKRWQQADSSNQAGLLKFGQLQNRVAVSYMTVNDLLDEVNYRIRFYSARLLDPEEKWIWQMRPGDYTVGFGQVLQRSVRAAWKIFVYYFQLNWPARAWTILLSLLLFGWTYNNIRLIKRRHQAWGTIMDKAPINSRSALLSALMVVFTFSVFFYEEPPVIYIELLWLLQVVFLTVLLWKSWPQWYRRHWLLLFVLYLLYGILNFTLQSSFTERYAQLALDVLSIALGFSFLRKLKTYAPVLPKYTRVVTGLFIILLVLAFVTNIAGRFTLSKFLSIGAIFTLLGAQSLYAAVRILLEDFYLQAEAYKSNAHFTAYFDYDRIHKGFQSGLYLVAGICWLVVITSNLKIYDGIRDWIAAVLTRERTLGSTTFSLGSVLIFLLVLWIAFFLSRAITIIFGGVTESLSLKKSRWGNAALLLRLAILAVGVLLAFTASGIPMDKLAIILGALGVGIGFGLQNIVNNLVSGIILAFEKPIRIGDTIGVGVESGTVTEIGIRASKLLTGEGSEVIVPNGDLLSQHIVNWTLSSQYRRVELTVGVAYGTELKQAKAIILEILAGQEGILPAPAASVFVHELADSSVNFRAYFWCDISRWVELKSIVLTNIYETFAASNIEIPFPQQDVHIRRENDLKE